MWIEIINILALVIGGVVFAIVANKRRAWAVAVVVAAAPTYLWRFRVGGVPFTFLELLILILVVVFVLQEWRNFPWLWCGDRREKFLVAMLAWFIVLGIFGMAVAPDLRVAAGVWKAYLVEPMLFFVVFVNTIKKEKDWRLVVGALGLAATVVAAVAVWQFFTGYGIPASWQAWPGRRAVSVYSYPNAIGLFVAPVAIFLIGLIVGGVGRAFWPAKKVKILLAVVIALLCASLVTARVEGAYLAVAAAVGVRLLFTRWRWWVVVGAAVIVIFLLMWEPTRNILLFRGVSGDVRLALWRGTINLLTHQPFWGAGLAGFPLVYDLYRLPSHVELLLYPHNIFLDFWVELGFLGLVWLVVVLIWYFKILWSHIRQKENVIKQQLAYSLMMAMVGVVVYGLIDVPYFKNDLALLFWTWLAMAVVLNKKSVQ